MTTPEQEEAVSYQDAARVEAAIKASYESFDLSMFPKLDERWFTEAAKAALDALFSTGIWLRLEREEAEALYGPGADDVVEHELFIYERAQAKLDAALNREQP